MLWINQYNIKPGPWRHLKEPGGIYMLRELVTHQKLEGVWTHLQDPLVIYEHLKPVYESINGKPEAMILKTYAEPLSEFLKDFIPE